MPGINGSGGDRRGSPLRNNLIDERSAEDWGERAERGFLASGIDPGDQKGCKNHYIDLLQKKALEEMLNLKGDEVVLDFGCGSGRISYWIAPRVRKVLGLEVTPEMLSLAEKHRSAQNVEFVLYDGDRFPSLSSMVDLVLSVGVLQIFRKEALTDKVSGLCSFLRPGGRMLLIEQVSDDPKVNRPCLNEYLLSFREAGLSIVQSYPIREGRWWPLYLIRYGIIPNRFLGRIAGYELRRLRHGGGSFTYYRDYLFALMKPGQGKRH